MNPLEVFGLKEWQQHTVSIPQAEEKAALLVEAKRREYETQEAHRAAYEKATWTERQLNHLAEELSRLKYDNDYVRWCFQGHDKRIQGPYPLRVLCGWFEAGCVPNLALSPRPSFDRRGAVPPLRSKCL